MADFDTLKYCRRLEESGVVPKHAEAHTEALAGALVAALEPLATKDDLRVLRSDLKDTEARLKADMLVLKADMIAHTDKKVAEIQRGQRWAVVIFLTVAVPVVGGLFTMIAGLHERMDGLGRPPVPAQVAPADPAPHGAAPEGARSAGVGPEAPDAGVDVSMAPTPRALEDAATVQGAVGTGVVGDGQGAGAAADADPAPHGAALEDARSGEGN